MPGRNATGPMGQGSMTGRRMGPCGDGYARGGHFHSKRGVGIGSHRGRYFAGGPRFAELSSQEQKDILSERKAFLENELNDLQKKLEEL